MADIFLSYASEDRERIVPLARLLESCGWSVFWDRKTPIGITWDEYIVTNLEVSRCVVVAWSNAGVKSKWVRSEGRYGLDREAYVPLLLERVQPPFPFDQIQAADLSNWRGDAEHRELGDLVAHLHNRLDQAQITMPSASSSAKPESPLPGKPPATDEGSENPGIRAPTAWLAAAVGILAVVWFIVPRTSVREYLAEYLQGSPHAVLDTGIHVDSIDELLPVDCLIPGEVRRRGSMTFLTPRQAIRISAHDCEVRGGEYVLRGGRDHALSVWEPQAQQGDRLAQTYVGEIYEKGIDVAPDYAKAAEWYRKAAEQGYPRAQNSLGALYENGLGVARNPAIALEWYRKASGLKEMPRVDPGFDARLRRLEQDLETKNRELDEKRQQRERVQQELDSLKKQPGADQRAQPTPDKSSARVKELEARLKELQNKLQARGVEVAALEGEVTQVRHGEAFGDLAPDFFGNYYALIIGNNDYQAPLSKLKTAINDAKRIAEVLEKRYGFKVTPLINARREDIIGALSDLGRKLTERDNLLLYYAGHGEMKKIGLQQGYWLPVDAVPGNPSNWITLSTDVTSLIEIAVMKAKHVLIIADSVYSGMLTRSAPEDLNPRISEAEKISWIRARAEKSSRTVITSGGLEPVLDSGGGQFSVFAKELITALEQNQEHLEARSLYEKIAPKVRAVAEFMRIEQTPEYGRLTVAGDDNGEFVFVPKKRLAKERGRRKKGVGDN